MNTEKIPRNSLRESRELFSNADLSAWH